MLTNIINNRLFRNYLKSIFVLAVVWLLSLNASFLFEFFEKSAEKDIIKIFFLIASLCVLSFIVFYTSQITKLPSFVIAIFFGLVAHPILNPIIEKHEILSVIVGLGATLILFGGGLETSYSNFKKILWKILSISFIGLIVTSTLFSITLLLLNQIFDFSISLMIIVLLGAILSSTDPAAIIPVLKNLRFFNRLTKDIVISESAVNDVVGTLLTLAFLSVIPISTNFSSISEWYGSILSVTSLIILLKQIAFGIIFGLLGYLAIEALQKAKLTHEQEFEADSAFFLFIPIIMFSFSLAFGGSGFLAAFIAGLLVNITKHLHYTEKFFNHVVDTFFKPTIFILLGALVDVRELLDYAVIGITCSLIFMFIIRPIAVFISLGIFTFMGQEKMKINDLLFISFVRETGAIPAVLIVSVASLQLGNIDGLVPIGMWVILTTLILEPIFTPYVAKKLKVAELIVEEKIHIEQKSTALFATRGHSSFIERIRKVADWCENHNIENITILLCLEDNYSDEKSEELHNIADKTIKEISQELQDKGLKALHFTFISRQGLLHDNIKALDNHNESIATIFVGKKVLDFRMNEIKTFKFPFYFLD